MNFYDGIERNYRTDNLPSISDSYSAFCSAVRRFASGTLLLSLVNPLSGVALLCFPYFTPSSKKGAKFESSTSYIANFDANFRKS